jgi:membrane protein DedA with SNARE-associated domain
MPEGVVLFITKYGYLAIFTLVILQETGMPNPIPNELLLMFSGYLSFKGIFSLPLLVLTAASADFIGANILYLLFIKAGSFIIKRKPKWIQLSAPTLNRMTAKMKGGGQLSFYIFRLTPFTRGYTSVIAGLLRVRPKVYLPVAFITAVTWATVYIVIGNIIGPSWDSFSQNISTFKSYMLIVLAVISGLVVLLFFIHKRVRNKRKVSMNIS